jgi:hypothetical protein
MIDSGNDSLYNLTIMMVRLYSIFLKHAWRRTRQYPAFHLEPVFVGFFLKG